MSEVKDLAAKQLQLQSHVDSIQEAIDVMLLLVPEEEKSCCKNNSMKERLPG